MLPTAPLLAASSKFEFGGMHVATWLLIAIGVVLIVRIGFKRDDAQETRRRKSIRASAACERIGLVRFASLFESYAVGDYTGVGRDVRKLAAYLRQAGKVEEVAVKVIETAGPLLLDNPLYAERVRKALTPQKPTAVAKPSEPTLH